HAAPDAGRYAEPVRQQAGDGAHGEVRSIDARRCEGSTGGVATTGEKREVEMMSAYLVPLANHLWQSTLFVIGVGLIALLLRKNRAAVRHRLWLAATIKFLVPFSLLTALGSHIQWRTPAAVVEAPITIAIEEAGQPFVFTPPPATPIQAKSASN